MVHFKYGEASPAVEVPPLVAVFRVLVVQVVGGVVWGQRWAVYARVVECTVALVSTVPFHHEVTTHRPL